MLETTSSFLAQALAGAERHGSALVLPLEAIADPEDFADRFEAAMEAHPSSPHLYYRVEPDGCVVASLSSEGPPSIRVWSAADPAPWLGFDPRGELEEQVLAVAETAPSSVLRPRKKPGRVKRVVGGYRFTVGGRQKKRRDQAKNIDLVLKGRRTGRRGLAKRIRAARKWHKSREGQRWHRAHNRNQKIGSSVVKPMKDHLAERAMSRFHKGLGECAPRAGFKRVETAPVKLRRFESGLDLGLGEVTLFAVDGGTPFYFPAGEVVKQAAALPFGADPRTPGGVLELDELRVHSIMEDWARSQGVEHQDDATRGAVYVDRGTGEVVVSAWECLLTEAQTTAIRAAFCAPGTLFSVWEDHYDPKRVLRECALSVLAEGAVQVQVGPRSWSVDGERLVILSPRAGFVRGYDLRTETLAGTVAAVGGWLSRQLQGVLRGADYEYGMAFAAFLNGEGDRPIPLDYGLFGPDAQEIERQVRDAYRRRGGIPEAALEKSPGHVAFAHGKEYYLDARGDLWVAPVDAVLDVRTGYRIGRWEAPAHLAAQRLKMLGLPTQAEEGAVKNTINDIVAAVAEATGADDETLWAELMLDPGEFARRHGAHLTDGQAALVLA